jgi:SAM-dependent methyltransferase
VPLQIIPDYRNLDSTGEARAAAERMEARARAPASEAMFRDLIVPLLTPVPGTVLEIGCGTAALSRRIARELPSARVCACDKSEGMLEAARSHTEAEQPGRIELGVWDVLDEGAFPFAGLDAGIDLIVSSVMVPYVKEARAAELMRGLARRLVRGGRLVFVEQDLLTDSVGYPSYDLFCRIYDRDRRPIRPNFALGLRPLLREAGLRLLPRRSFLWTDEEYTPYTRELLERYADSACEHGRVTPAERDEWKRTLDSLLVAGDFHYGLVYHRIAAERATVP